MGVGMVLVASEEGLTVIKDEGQVFVFEGAKLEKKSVMFKDPELFPLLGFHPMKKCPSRLMWNFLQHG